MHQPRERGCHRCDLALVCSPVELELLVSWGVPCAKLCPAPFFMDTPSQASLPGDAPPMRRSAFDSVTIAMPVTVHTLIQKSNLMTSCDGQKGVYS